MFSTNTMTRSNHNLFIPYDTGSPHDSLMTHIAGLGRIARLDFERCAVARDGSACDAAHRPQSSYRNR